MTKWIGLLILFLLSLGSLFLGVCNVTLWGLLTNQDEQMMVFLVSRVPRLIATLAAGTGMSVVGLPNI